MAETILTVFRRNALKFQGAPCFHHKKNGKWEAISWADAEEQVRRIALGLSGLGLKPGQTVAIWASTRVEWTLLDLAALACGGVVVPIYSSLIPEQVQYILQDSKAVLLVVEKKAQWESLSAEIKRSFSKVICLEENGGECMNLSSVIAAGNGIAVNLYDEQLKQLKPTDNASIIYTSGTTGRPKGAVLTHKNILGEVMALQGAFPFQKEDIGLMCLPLPHVMARALQFYQLAQGCQLAYVPNLEDLAQSLQEMHPTFLMAVPRLLEKVAAKVEQEVQKLPTRLQAVAHWSQRMGLATSEIRQKKKHLSWKQWLAYKTAYWIALRKLKVGLGGKLTTIISGGAPLSKEIAQFFHAHDIVVLEGYGLTETFAAITLNLPDDFRFGTVGKPMEGVRIKLNSDGEICVKGDMVFSGYLNLKEETREAFDEEGWFLTGDIGDFTKDGFLRITDRKKDIIVTSGGKKISPQNIEAALKHSPYISQAIVLGDGQKFISALVTLERNAVLEYAKQAGISINGKSLSQHPEIYNLIQKEVEEINRHLAPFESIKKFAILDEDFSIEKGEMTPTMKVKRKVVAERYQNVLEQFYR